MVQTLVLVQTLMLLSTRHIFCSEIPCESDHLQRRAGMCPPEGKGEAEGSLLTQGMFLQVDEDFIPQDYRLQYRKSAASPFEDVYVGSESEFMVLHIDPHVDYQFRVCARGDGRQEWSPWSVPQIGRTTLVPHGTAQPWLPRGWSWPCSEGLCDMGGALCPAMHSWLLWLRDTQ